MTSPEDPPSLALRAVSAAWSWRYELAGSAAVLATACVPVFVPPARRWLGTYFRRARTRRLLRGAFRETQILNGQGKAPRVRRIRATPYGERVELSARPGQWADLLEVRADPLAAALKAAGVRIDKDPQRTHRITMDVLRKDPFAADRDIPWEGHAAETLSLWDEVHLGRTETGESLWLSLVERSLITGGLPGSGKSNLLRLLAAHAAKSPDAHLLLIDPNKVQFAPWRYRALAYASQDQDEALDVLFMVQAEVNRRLDLLTELPGAPEKVTRAISVEHGLPLWLVMIDELAYHTSTAANPEKRARFSALLRDIVSRCRAAGVIVVVATQRPTDRVVPRELSDLFSLRLAFNVTSPANSDVILGESWAKRGFDASRIGLDSPGVGLLLAEGRRPDRLRTARITPEQVAELSVTTVAMKPRGTVPTLVNVAA